MERHRTAQAPLVNPLVGGIAYAPTVIDTYTLHEVVGGVWAAVAPGFAGPAVSNAAIIDLGDKTVVFDTFMTGRAAGELAADARRLTGREAFLVVNSHWHSDHIRGNHAFPDIPIVGTRRMLELIVEDLPDDRSELLAAAERIRGVAAQRAAAAETDTERAEAEGTLALAEAIAADAEAGAFALPDLLIGERLDIEGERSLVVLGHGPGHTESDLYGFLPDAGVLIAGDLVWSGLHPKTDDSFPSDWANVLAEMEALRPAAVVPGHGPAGGGEQVGDMAAYMRALVPLVESVRSGGLDVSDAEPPPGPWEGVERFRAGLEELRDRPG